MDANAGQGPLHPKIEEARDLMERGRLGRRDFVRIAALLGVGAGAAYALAGLPAPAEAADSTPFPVADPAAKKGGVLKVAMQVQPMDDPATYAWVEMSNQTRHIVEYLTFTGTDNITRPMLAESWEANDDLTVWTFKIRSGVRWHNGDLLTAQQVRASLERALDPELGAGGVTGLSTFAAMTALQDGETRMIPGSIETPDERTLVLRLQKPVLSVPEDCYNYPAAILHPSFKAPFSENPIGTGPFTLEELTVGERCVLKRVSQTTDGKPFEYWGGEVFLDEIHYYNFDEEAQLEALAAGTVDAIYEFGIEQLDLARSLLDAKIILAQTAQTLVCRMQVSQAPFDDPRVRKAIQLSVDREAVMRRAFPVGAVVAEDHHVAPLHPEYFRLPPLERDLDRARALLAEAGQEDLEITLDVGNTDGPWHQSVCEAIRDQFAEAGIRLTLNIMPPAEYWGIWKTSAFGATAWTHRPLGTMSLSLGYRSGVPWNETHFSDPEFDAALDAAEASLDVEERRAKMEEVERRLQEAAVILQPLWRPVLTLTKAKVQGYPAHPTQYHQFNKVWLA